MEDKVINDEEYEKIKAMTFREKVNLESKVSSDLRSINWTIANLCSSIGDVQLREAETLFEISIRRLESIKKCLVMSDQQRRILDLL
jgi:hypothetical protein